jgi:glycosyltransferase involved in cell wall biosynthesis
MSRPPPDHPPFGRPLRAVFVMEQHVGHRTFYLNLRHGVEAIPGIETAWAEVTYAQAGGFYERLPFLPEGARGALRGRSQARRGLRSGYYDTAYFNTQVPAALAVPLPRGLPFVVSTDITPAQYDRMAHHYGHQADRFEPVKSLKRALNARLLRDAARVLPWSTWARESLIADYHVDPRRIEVMPPGIDLDLWKPRPDPRRAGRLRILFIGADFHRKGGDVLLHALSYLPPDTFELHAVTRSTVPVTQTLTRHGHMRPNSAELVGLARSCDVFVLPSEAEAYGIAAAEACAAGLPVIASRMGGMVDIVDDGRTGFIITPGDARTMADCLRRLADDDGLRIRMGAAARERAADRFDLRRISQRLVTILTEVVQSHSPQGGLIA